MNLDERERIQSVLQEMQHRRGLEPLKRLFLTELEYDPENITLFRDRLPESARVALADDPQILFSAGGANDRFYVIYCCLADTADRLLLTKERVVVTLLLQKYPYALFVFSNRSQDQWHFVNVKYDKDDRARRLFRRIAISRVERLRTAIDRFAELNVGRMVRDTFELSAFQVQQAHDHAFDVEKVTRDFFEAYRKVFKELQADLRQQTGNLTWAHDYSLQFLNRVMFLYFVQRKLWLSTEQEPKGDPDFLNTFWQLYRTHGRSADTFYSRWLGVLFFNAFNQGEKQADDEAWAHLPASLRRSMADAPYLNGGLFRRNALDERTGFAITDERFGRIFDFLERYNFTISEDTPLDQEVAVDPEMIGKVYESLVNVSEDETGDERSEAGIFYTPRTEIDLMCRLSLVDWLANHLGEPHKPLLYDVVFAFTEDEKRVADDQLRQYNLWPTIDTLTKTLQVLDPACGSGSFLIGMLAVLDDLSARIDHELGVTRSAYERRRDIIGRNLYGVDVKDWAVHVAELRLWLQLIIETEITATEAKVRPLLPNLSFKIRCGDSLVQDVGGINLAVRHSGQLPDRAIAGRINQLRGEKLNYYTNATNSASLKQLQDKEFQVFVDLLHTRRTKIESRATDIGSALSTTTDLFGEQVSNVQSSALRTRLELELTQLDSELEQVKRAQDALKTVHDMPFVWDIAFVEVFESERRGFDIVIGNPPYVRHEEIRDPHGELTNAEYKERLARAVYSAWPQTFGYYQSNKKKRWPLDAKSDLYIYFYFHALSLLNEHGTFCFVTSNSWLDVGYGHDLQEFLLTHGHLKLLIDNQSKRSFAAADVNTVIVLLSAAQDRVGIRQDTQTKTVRFVMFNSSFQLALNASIWHIIDTSQERYSVGNAGFRVFPITQADLLENAQNENVEFRGDKWGGKYLRAPDVYWRLTEQGKGCLTQLQRTSYLRFGVKTGANEFFHLDEITILKWEIEPQYLKPVIRSSRECESIFVDPQNLHYQMLVCHANKDQLKGTNVLEYIKWGETMGFDKRPSCKSRARWYDIGIQPPADFIMLRFRDLRNWTPILPSSDFLVGDTVFVGECIERKHVAVSHALLNSSLQVLMSEIYGRVNLGDGLLTTYGPDLAVMPVVDPICALPYERELTAILESLAKRKVMSILDEMSMPDHQELDALVCRILGLPAQAQLEVYDAIHEMVEKRINKAKSLQPNEA